MSKDIRVTIKARNNRLLKAIKAAGFESGIKFAKRVGINYIGLNDLVNMTRSAIDRKGNLRPDVEKLCAFLNKMPAELFSGMQMYGELKNNTADVEMSKVEVAVLMSNPATLEHKELMAAIDIALASLTEHENYVLRMRNGIDCNDMDYEQCASIMGATKERVRQIEAKALRKLRHPDRSIYLKEFLNS